MPRVRRGDLSPSNLKEMCFESVGRNLDKFWCKMIPENAKKFRFLLGPLEDLPSFLIDEIWAYLRPQIRAPHLDFLLSSRLSGLYYPGGGSGITHQILKLGARRLFNLTFINLSGSSNLHFPSLFTILGGSPSLSSLDLSHTAKLPDPLFSLLGSEPLRSSLVEFNLSFTSTSDENLSRYALQESTPLNLKVLKLEETLVSFPKVASLYSRFSNLQEFICYFDIRFVSQYSSDHIFSSFRNLAGNLYSDDLSRSLALCPGAQNFKLEIDSQGTEDLHVRALSLNQLENIESDIKTLDVINSCFRSRFHFGWALDSTLCSRGSTLEVLSVTHTLSINLDIIILNCPLLRHLSIDQACFICPTENVCKLPVTKLAYFRCGVHTVPPTNEQMVACITSEYLETLVLENFTDLHENFQIFGPMKKLKTLKLCNCANITMEHMKSLLYSKNELKDLIFRSCSEILSSDLETYIEYCLNQSWDVEAFIEEL